MKIAIIRQRYNPHGGAERFVSRALAALTKQKSVSLYLIARSWEPIPDIQFHRCNPFYLGRLSRDAGFAFMACKTARALGADIVQSHERLGCCDIYRAGDGVHREWIIQKNRDLPFIKRWAMRCNPYHLYVQWIERRMFESGKLRAVICNSQMVKTEILNYFSIDAEKIHVIYNGVDTDAFHPGLKQQRNAWRAEYSIPLDVPVFLFVGSGFERKGLQQAIEALTGVQQQACLAIVGYDKHEKHYRALAEQLGLQQRVMFCGPQQDVKPFYGLADAFILPTLYDPFSNAVLEAMACGLPVITSYKAGVAELLQQGVSGFISDAHAIGQFSAAMRQLCDTGRAAEMGRQARQIAERYDWQTLGDAMQKLYQSLVDTDTP